MPDINPEMLKQLLAEFEEKQAVTTEEINEIEKQIEELQARIELSRDRLIGVERDREKIGAMKSRYAGGDWSSVLTELAAQKSAAPEPAAPAASAAPALSAPEKSKKGKSNNAEASDNGFGKKAAPAPEPTPQEAPPAPPPLAPTMEMDMPQTLPTPPAPPTPPSPAGESLFPFSQATQENTGDLPWAPTPAMSWDTVAAQSFPPPDLSEPQPNGFPLTPDGTNPFLEAGQKLGIPNPQSFGQPPAMLGQPQPGQAAPAGFEPPAPFPAPAQPNLGQPPGPPQGAGAPGAPQQAPQQAISGPALGNPEFLSTAFDDEFDIADALRGDNDQPSGEKEEGDVKKINDALRGLFS